MKRFGLILVLTAATALAQQLPIEQVRQKARLTEIQVEEIASQMKLAELRKTYSDSHPDVVRAKARLDQLHAQEAVLTKMGSEAGLPDRWWRNPAAAQSLGLTPEQQKKMDDVFQQYRLKLIDLNAALEKEEVTLEPLMSSEPLDESKTSAQIDRVAQARAELEKSNGRMLLGIRKLLTPEQWNKLNASKLQGLTDTLIKAGDTLVVTGLASDGMARVKPDGTVVLPIAGAVRAEGLTPLQFQQAAERALSAYIKNPQISVSIFHRSD